ARRFGHYRPSSQPLQYELQSQLAPLPASDRRIWHHATSGEYGKRNRCAPIALLAPVPRVHLESALETDTPDGQATFGTRAWELFNELDQRRAGLPVDVYIYESHQEGSFEGKVTWHARYIRS